MAATPVSLPERIVSFIEASSAMAEKAAAAEQTQQQRETQASTLIPGIVDTLAQIRIQGQSGTIPLLDADEKTACAEALRDPVRALHILTKVAQHFHSAQPERLGQESRQEKTAQSESPYTGRRTSQEPESWRRFRQQILGG